MKRFGVALVVIMLGIAGLFLVTLRFARSVESGRGAPTQQSSEMIETILVTVRAFRGTKNEQLLAGSSLIEYQGQTRMIVSREHQQYVLDQIEDISTSIPRLALLSPYCVELSKPEAQYDATAAAVIDRARASGLLIGCERLPQQSEVCPNVELAGVKGHPFTATAVVTTKGSPHDESLTQKLARDVDGVLYTYETQHEDGISFQQFEMNDPKHHLKRIWKEGDTQGMLLQFGPETSKIKLLSEKSLGNRHMEGYDVQGHQFTCLLGPNVSVNYQIWQAPAVGVYVDLQENNSSLSTETHLTHIVSGTSGLGFFLPSHSMKFEPPGPQD